MQRWGIRLDGTLCPAAIGHRDLGYAAEASWLTTPGGGVGSPQAPAARARLIAMSAASWCPPARQQHSDLVSSIRSAKTLSVRPVLASRQLTVAGRPCGICASCCPLGPRHFKLAATANGAQLPQIKSYK